MKYLFLSIFISGSLLFAASNEEQEERDFIRQERDRIKSEVAVLVQQVLNNGGGSPGPQAPELHPKRFIL